MELDEENWSFKNTSHQLESWQMSNLFYFCPESECNRKYKTKDRMIKHLETEHQKTNAVSLVGEPQANTKENTTKDRTKKAKAVQTNKANFLKEKEEDFKRRVEQEFADRLEKEKKMNEEQLERNRKAQADMAEQKRINDERELQLTASWHQVLEKISNAVANNQEECLICCEKEQTTSCLPCGHKRFCFECITKYYESFPHRGCPVCRGEILFISRIY